MSERIIVVTGATRGLGRALVEAFVAAGHRVAGCGRNADQIAELDANFGEGNLFGALDVTSSSSVRAFAERVFAEMGTPTLLINAAAMMNKMAPLWAIPEVEFVRTMNINVCGTVNVIRAFVPKMVEAKAGAIVNLSAGYGRNAAARVGPYCASKYAVEGLSKSLAAELPAGMACVPLNPGIIDTDMLQGAMGAGAKKFWSAGAWAKKAAPFILELAAKDNGRSLDCPNP